MCVRDGRSIRWTSGCSKAGSDLFRLKVNPFMVTPAIRDFSQQIVEKFSPERVILFGSHARNEEGPDSDVDMLVILSHDQDRNVLKAIEILQLLNPPFSIDLLVRRPEDVERRLSMRDYFMRDIMKEGKVLYEARGN
jgi:uncharacterized protein